MRKLVLACSQSLSRSPASPARALVTMVARDVPLGPRGARRRGGAAQLQHARPALARERHRRVPHPLGLRPLERLAGRGDDRAEDPGLERAPAGLARRGPRLGRRLDGGPLPVLRRGRASARVLPLVAA